MPRGRFLDRNLNVLGGSVSAAVALLIGATLLASILAAQVRGFLHAVGLVPRFVLHGEVWRLASFVLVEPSPLALIFAALVLYFVGRDLVRVWGATRFLAAYFGLAVAAGAITCAVALAFDPLALAMFVGAWPVVSALIVAWACVFPNRTILLYFLIPLHGRNLIYATFAGTLLFALLGGSITAYIPDFAAQLAALAWMKGNPIRPLWARMRFELAYGRWRRRASRLREVPRPPRDDENPRYYH